MEEIARVYARSLFEVAKEQDKLDVVREQLGEIADAISKDRELQLFFFSPYFSTEEKKDGLAKVIEGAEPAVLNFLELLVEKHRSPALFRIRTAYDELWEHENKLLPVTITSAVELDKDTLKEIGKKIEDNTGRTVNLTTKVDPNVIGGLVMRVGNIVMDGSIRARLERLRKQVAKAA